jgi:hydrogenase 3 maturation protease
MNPSLKKKLVNRLKGFKKIVLLGIGSQLRGDDYSGIIVALELDEFIRKSKKKRAKVFFGETAPENFTGSIKKFKPTHIILVDSADMGKPAGAIDIIDPERISGVTFSTHQLPLNILIDYLKKSLDCQVLLIGIQPKGLKFNSKISAPAKKSSLMLAGLIKEIIGRRIK